MITYEDYLASPLALSFDDMRRLHSQMLESIGDDPDAMEIYEELIGQAIRYSEFRSNWLLWPRERKAERDAARTSCHDSIIIKFNMLARYLSMNGRPTGWRDELGDEKREPMARKRIGDFSCYLVFIYSIEAR